MVEGKFEKLIEKKKNKRKEEKSCFVVLVSVCTLAPEVPVFSNSGLFHPLFCRQSFNSHLFEIVLLLRDSNLTFKFKVIPPQELIRSISANILKLLVLPSLLPSDSPAVISTLDFLQLEFREVSSHFHFTLLALQFPNKQSETIDS
jgi:hypothetical protein